MDDANLMREELCRVITGADRWLTIDLAWQALLRIRLMHDSMEREAAATEEAPAKTSDNPLGLTGKEKAALLRNRLGLGLGEGR